VAEALTLELLAAADRSATGNGDSAEAGALRTAGRVTVTVGHASGGASVQVSIETRGSDVAPWRSVEAEVWNEGVHAFAVDGLERHVRASWKVLAGTTVHLAVSLQAHQLYCARHDITLHALPARATEAMGRDDLVSACIAASTSVEDYLASAYTPPITAWPESVRMHAARLAGAHLLSIRGVDPGGPDALVFDNAKDSVKWLQRIADGKLKPPGIVDSTPAEFEGGSVVVSSPARRW
jgi:phage gp36-like protein